MQIKQFDRLLFVDDEVIRDPGHG